MSVTEYRFPADQLKAFTAALLIAARARTEDAREVSTHLIEANLTGHDSQGIGMLPAYLHHIEQELVSIDASDKIIKEMGVILQIDAMGGWGKPAARRLIERASVLAKTNGLAAATLSNVHHLGRIGAYGEQAADAGLVSMHFVNVTDHAPLVAPFRGSDARFGTNPVCICFPATPNRSSFLLDMATSKIALGKVRIAASQGHKLPPGSLITETGMPTDDPSGMAGDELKGALTPLGHHKGYGLAFACDLLAGLLSGGGTLQPDNPRRGGIQNSMLSILIHPEAFGDTGWMAHEMEAMSEYALASPPMDWDSPVLFPGDPERAWRGKRERDGIPLDEATIALLNKTAVKVGSKERL